MWKYKFYPNLLANNWSVKVSLLYLGLYSYVYIHTLSLSIWKYKSNIVYYANHTQNIVRIKTKFFYSTVQMLCTTKYINILQEIFEQVFLHSALFPVTFIWFYIKYGKDVIYSSLLKKRYTIHEDIRV